MVTDQREYRHRRELAELTTPTPPVEREHLLIPAKKPVRPRCVVQQCRNLGNQQQRGFCVKHYRKWLSQNRGGDAHTCTGGVEGVDCKGTPTVRLNSQWWCDDCCPTRGWALVRKMSSETDWSDR